MIALQSAVPPPASLKEPIAEAGAGATLADLRFRTLVGEEAWARLPESVRRRFSKRIAPGEAALYRGRVVETRLSAAGRLLSLLTRLIGAPLPRHDGATGAAVVSVVDDPSHGCQSWTRTYVVPGRRPQTIHSLKRFRGATGLEEYVGGGIGMALRVTVEAGALYFRSDHYFLELGPMRMRLPRMLAPGEMEIVHRDEGGGTFSFRLRLVHPRLGVLLHQLATFEDV